MRPLADGSAPEPPEGFTIVVKDNGLMVLRKKRYRDLKKVGIGGFLAKTRTPKMSNKKGENAEDEKKKRAVWKPKKNKILMQYPEYIQDSFFGKEFMGICPDKVDEETNLVQVDMNRVAKQDSGTSIVLSSSALDALERMKAKEEAEKKEKEQELEEARLAAEAAAKEAADKARIAKEELDALKLNSIQVKDDDTNNVIKDEKMTEEDLMLPTDLFGDDLFKNLMSGGDIDIDESALDVGDGGVEGTEADGNNIQSELAAGLRDMMGPGFDNKDMEDIFKGFSNDEDTPKPKTEVKEEPSDELPGDVNETLKNLESQHSSSNDQQAQGSLQIKEELMSSAEEINAAATSSAASSAGTMTATMSSPSVATADIKTEIKTEIINPSISNSASMIKQQSTSVMNNTQQQQNMIVQQQQLMSNQQQQQMPPASQFQQPIGSSPMMSQSPMMSPVQQQSPIQQMGTSPVMGGGMPQMSSMSQGYTVGPATSGMIPGAGTPPMGGVMSSSMPVSMQQMSNVVSTGPSIVGAGPSGPGMMQGNRMMGPRMAVSMHQQQGRVAISSSMPMASDQMMVRGPRPMYTGMPPGSSQVMTVSGMPQRPGMMQGQRPMMMNPMSGGVVRTVIGQPGMVGGPVSRPQLVGGPSPGGQMGPRAGMSGGVGVTRESAQAQHLAKWAADEPLGKI